MRKKKLEILEQEEREVDRNPTKHESHSSRKWDTLELEERGRVSRCCSS